MLAAIAVRRVLANVTVLYCWLIREIIIIIIIIINKLFEIDFETNVSHKSFIEEQRFEAIIASLSSSNNKYR